MTPAAGRRQPIVRARDRMALPPNPPPLPTTQDAPATTRHAMPTASALFSRSAATTSTFAPRATTTTNKTNASAVTGAAAELAAWDAHARAALDLVATTTTGVREEVASELSSVRRLLARARARRARRGRRGTAWKKGGRPRVK